VRTQDSSSGEATGAGSWRAPALLTGVAFAVALAAHRLVYPLLSWNRDEPVYLWQADLLRHGQLRAPDLGYPGQTIPWLSGARGGHLFSQYTLGWPAVLAVGDVLGSPAVAAAAASALAVLGAGLLTRELTGDRRLASWTAVALLASPVYVIQAGTYLTYLFGLGLGLLATTAALRGMRTRGRARACWWGAGGLLLGLEFATRPYDGVLWGVVCVLVLAIVERRSLRELVTAGVALALGAIPLVVLVLLSNRQVTGGLLRFPISVADPLDRFGFGDRRLMPRFGVVPYGKRLALEGAARNAGWAPVFLVGGPVGAVLVSLGAWRSWLDRPQRQLLAVAVVIGGIFPLAYLPFFGTDISSLTARLSAPIYYLPAYYSCCLLLCLAVRWLRSHRPRVGAALVALAVMATVPLTASRIAVNHGLSEAQRPWHDADRSLPDGSLVVISPGSYLMFLNPFADNGHSEDPDVLYAVDVGRRLIDLVLDHPERTAFLQRADRTVDELRPREDGVTPHVRTEQMRLVTGPEALAASVDASHLPPGAQVWLELDGHRVGPGHEPSPEMRWQLGVGGTAHADGSTAVLPPGSHTLAVAAGVRTAKGLTVLQRTGYHVRVGSDASSTVVLDPPTASRRSLDADGLPTPWVEALALPAISVRLEGGAVRPAGPERQPSGG
jgi:hypothetical protein